MHLALLKIMVDAQEWQASMVAQSLGITEEYHQMLNSNLALVTSFVPVVTQSLALTLGAAWQPTASQLSAPAPVPPQPRDDAARGLGAGCFSPGSEL